MNWKSTDRFETSGGVGTRVERECDGQLGYAKTPGINQERLASCLAQLINAPVPLVETCEIGGIPHVISHVNGPESLSLETFKKPYSQQLQQALRVASGLLPLLAWLQSDDHSKDENFVVDDVGDVLQVRAIDFEHAFAFRDREEIIEPPKPGGLTSYVERARVEEMVTRIEGLSFEEIAECCNRANLPQMADVLRRRQTLIRPAMIESGWLPA